MKYHNIVFVVDPPEDYKGDPEVDMVFRTRGESFNAAKRVLESSSRAKLVLPKSTADDANAAGIDFARMTTTDSDLRVEFFKAGIYARTYAVPSADPDPHWTMNRGYSQLGYLLRFDQCTIYH